MKKIILSVMVLFVISSCTSKKAVAENKNETPATTSTTTEMSMADIIAQGETLFVNNCAGCHALPKVKDHSPENWKPILLRMQKAANISDLERERIYNYIVMQ